MRKFAILLLLANAAVHSAVAQNNGLSVELELDQKQYLPEEDMQVKVTIVNRSGQPVLLGTEKQWITFDVIGEHQYIVPRLGEMSAKNPFTLLSGQSVTKVFNPTPYFDFRKMGNYSLGAIVKVPQWKQEVPCRPVLFTVSEGSPLPHLPEMTFGVPAPPGVTNAAPDVRHYSLLKVNYLDQMKLYVRLTDSSGHTLRVFPLARMVDFREPEAQMDRANNYHVMFQTGARIFTYCVLDPNGNLVAREYHEFTQSRPSLHLAEDGTIFVGGGRRRPTWNDLPAPAPVTAAVKNP